MSISLSERANEACSADDIGKSPISPRILQSPIADFPLLSIDATVPIGEMMDIVKVYRNAGQFQRGDNNDDNDELPACLESPLMPRDSELVIKYLRDGQARTAFGGVAILAVLVERDADQKVYDLMSEFCRFLTRLQETRQLLQSFLLVHDINMFTSRPTEEEVTTNRVDRFREFDGEKVVPKVVPDVVS